MADNPLKRPNDIIGMPALLDALKQATPVPESQIAGHTRRTLSQIIPAEDWWHLYLDRQHFEKAVADTAARTIQEPGFLYDSEKSPGFQRSLVEAYKQVLDGDAYKDAFDNATITYAIYEEFYKLVTKYVKMPPPNEGVNYGIKPGIVASDAPTEMVSGRPLLKMGPAGNPVSFVMGAVNPAGAIRGIVSASLEERPGLSNAAFATFHIEIGAAQNRKAQLTAIARLIRTLHVLHGFPDGNGRLNVYFLLPRLMLQYGFGLPIRLGPLFTPDTVFGLFNGCFTVDQIVTFLWYSQQLPGDPIENLDLSLVKNWGRLE